MTAFLQAVCKSCPACLGHEMAGSLGRDANQRAIKIWLSFISSLPGRRGLLGTHPQKEETRDDWVFPLFAMQGQVANECCLSWSHLAAIWLKYCRVWGGFPHLLALVILKHQHHFLLFNYLFLIQLGQCWKSCSHRFSFFFDSIIQSSTLMKC